MKRTTRTRRPVVTADGTGIVSHAGAALLRELADESGLTEGWTDALLGTYKGTPVHLPGRVLTDLAVTFADGGDCPLVQGVVMTTRAATPNSSSDQARVGGGRNRRRCRRRRSCDRLSAKPPRRRQPSRRPAPDAAA